MLNNKKVLFTICMVLLSCSAIPVFATQTTYTFYPSADSYLTGGGHLNENEGLNTALRIQHPSNFSHVLLKFSEQEILSTLGTSHVVSASLQLYIETNFNNWGTGKYVEAHLLEYDWTETGSTWNCPTDTNLGNTNPDCDDIWEGGYYSSYISDSLLHQNGQTGWKNYNVTSDVQLHQNGISHYGWLIRKRNHTDSGSIDYTSIQGTASQKPRLVVVVDDLPCSPTSINSIIPGVVPSDGTPKTVTVSGSGLDRITEIKIDNSPITFSLVDSSTVTFVVNYSSIDEHDLWFRSNCLSEPLTNYSIIADSVTFADDAPEYAFMGSFAAGCGSYPAETLFTRNGPQLCWKSSPTRMIGYTGDFSLINWNFKWTDSATSSTSTPIEVFMKAGQYQSGNGNASRGFDLVRVGAMGGSCNFAAGPENCKGYPREGGLASEPERMPFQFSGGNYSIHGLTTFNGNKLDTTWKRRLGSFIKYANQNGIAVMLHLFDENSLSGDWDTNPWNPNNNDLNENGCGALSASAAFPNFYQICTNWTDQSTCNNSLNCWGLRQRAYVRSVVQVVKNQACPSRSGKCRNVIFEVMNEAKFDKNWGISKAQFKVWHDTVAQWVKGKGRYMVAANVKGAPANNVCGSGVSSDFCLLDACTSTSCPTPGSPSPPDVQNYFEAFHAPRIDIVSLHWGTWEDDMCNRDNAALDFQKPVIFDDDGGPAATNTNRNVERWAQGVGPGDGSGVSCDQTKGKVHFYHTKDGAYLEPDPPAGLPDYRPTSCVFNDEQEVDCQAWNGLADGIPTRFCGPAAAGACTMRLTYCEGGSSGCPQNQE